MTQRVGAKGQVVIPKEIRDKVGLHPGTQVDVSTHGKEVVLTIHRPDVSLSGRYRHSGMAARLVEDRAAEPR